MRTVIILPLIMLFCSIHSSAQVLYPTQPEQGYYQDLKAMILPVVPTDQQLINAKSIPLPGNFKDTLLRYDWYEIASYYVLDKTYSSKFGKELSEHEVMYANTEFAFKRYTPQGVTYEMKLDYYKNGSIKVFTTTFDEATAVKLVEVKKVGARNMMVTSCYGETEMQEILSYKDGVMIMKIKQSPNTTTKIFIIAYYAVPKTF